LTDRHDEQEEAPSLLERESTGGDMAEGGFSFQESVMMSYVPAWLAFEGFEQMTRESMGDIEAKFFVPGREPARELVEVKNHRITPTEFWSEVDRFRQLDEGSPGTFHWFTLIGGELANDLHRLRNGLRRLRGPYSFYEGTGIADSSFAGYAKIVKDMNRSQDEARFLFERVLIRDDLTTDESQWKAVFHDQLAAYFPEYGELSYATLRSVYDGLGELLRSHRNRSIARREIEEKIRERIPTPSKPPIRPVVLRTAIAEEIEEAGPNIRPIRFDWTGFFGGEDRSYPPPEDWNEQLLGELRQTKSWILQHRAPRRIRLTGNRRLSASLAIGTVFSAVAGFSVEMENRGGELWATDAHPSAETPAFPLEIGGEMFPGERLVVSVGVLRHIADEVDRSLGRLGLAGAPTLHLHPEGPVFSAEHANKAAKCIKDTILEGLATSGSAHVDLFLAGPAFLALSLGHRMNATATVQCYEWVSRDRYVPTCALRS
jgi:hypothetical protein